VALIKDHAPARAGTLTFAVGAGLLTVGLLVSLALNNKHFAKSA
jgi:hypothetical protein